MLTSLTTLHRQLELIESFVLVAESEPERMPLVFYVGYISTVLLNRSSKAGKSHDTLIINLVGVNEDSLRLMENKGA